ncbi:MAG TPA: SpoIIE family protein phosphatase [Thermoanaerobaculia bacterium]
MKLRTQLAFAFLLLAVLPLGAIVVYSHVASERAFRQAVWAESEALAGAIETRLASTRAEIRDRITRLGDLSADESSLTPEDLARRFGNLELPYVESVEVVPEAEAAGEPVVHPRPSAAPGTKLPRQPLVVYLQRPRAVVPEAPAAPEVELDVVIQRQILETTRQALAAHEAELAQVKRELSHADLQALKASWKKTKGLLGDLSCPIQKKGEVLGRIQAHVKASALLAGVFSDVRRDQGEIPFALDAEGQLYVLREEDQERLAGLDLRCGADHEHSPDWVVVSKKDVDSGLCYGVARPIQHSLATMRRAAAESFAWGVGLVGLCLAGIFPLSGRITRNLSSLMTGVERIGRGDLEARVPVRSRDELGRLGEAFNHMAAELCAYQERLLDQERRQKEQELHRRLLEAEHARKSEELEQARRFQLSLLPRELPRRADLDLAVFTRTATEVGGDYYDFLEGAGGSLTVAIGDATGHGAASGTMVTVVKGLFMARAGEIGPAAFLCHANDVLKRMQLGRMAMALSILQIRGRRLRVSSAGMPPLLLWRAATREVEEICLKATPLGAIAEHPYQEREVELAEGDTLLLATDGFPELVGESGDPLGYPGVHDLFARAADKDPGAIISDLTAAADRWRGESPLCDDLTFVVLRVR